MRCFPRLAAIFAVSFLLSGCGLPPAAQIASLIADGFSLLATDKTITDHGLSVASGKDCAVWRGVSGDDVCREVGEGETAVAEADGEVEAPLESMFDAKAADEEPADENKQAALPRAIAEPVEVAPLSPPAAVLDVEVIDNDEQEIQLAYASDVEPVKSAPSTPPSQASASGAYFVLASFARSGNAERFALKNADLTPQVAPVDVRGRTMHRVVIGPVAKDQRPSLRAQLAALGFKSAWAVSMSAPPLARGTQVAELR